MQHDIIRLQHMLDAGKDALQFALAEKELTFYRRRTIKAKPTMTMTAASTIKSR